VQLLRERVVAIKPEVWAEDSGDGILDLPLDVDNDKYHLCVISMAIGTLD
jgi:hypothetical protein